MAPDGSPRLPLRAAVGGLAIFLTALVWLVRLESEGRVREEEALRQSLTLAHGVLWAQSALLNFLATGESSFAGEHRAALREVEDATTGVIRADKNLGVPASLLSQSARELAGEVAEWRVAYATPALAFKQARETQRLSALTRKGVGARLALAMTAALNDLKAHVEQTLALHAAALVLPRRTAGAAALAGAAAFVAGGAVFLRRREEAVRFLQARAERAQVQGEFAERLHFMTSADDVAHQLALALARRAPHAAVVLKEDEGPGLRIAASEGLLPPGADGSPLLAEPGMCPVIRTGHRYAVTDVVREGACACPLGAPARGGYACAPLMARGRVAGVANWKPPGAGQLTLADLEAGEGLSRIASLALSSLSQLATAREEAVTDQLTTLPNRRFLDGFLEKQALAARRLERPLAVVMLDLDRFKTFNDRHGHPAGDALLRAVAQSVAACVREGDLAARYGGEEFTVVLPEAGRDTALEIAGRIRERVAALAAAALGPAAPPGLQPGFITLSAGIAIAPEHGRRAGELLRAADAALYRAKEAGRDRVVIAT